ncbi:unnamed protein product [Thlaspi arvense]|uniref:SKP1-like protein n=1 Tax=Thlaspi arvense TaxID=13288 RepID=A0AAU9SPH5_THLAR|nr:unnamed protein product [Thlaspi arvense]
MSKKNIVLKSSNGITFEVEEAVALQPEAIAYMIEDDCANDTIPLANITGDILTLLIEYCKKHVPKIFNLLLAADFLNIKTLFDLTCQFVADTMIKGKTVVEVRRTLNIEKDYTSEEEAEVRQENEWAFK